jgi:hypothetical protein
MSTERRGPTRSFAVSLFDRTLTQRLRFVAPLSVAAPFANRLVREMIQAKDGGYRELWYELTPRSGKEPRVPRAPRPEGPTSLYSALYVPANEPPPRVELHPDAHVQSFAARLLDYDREVFSGEYTVDDVFLAVVEFLVRNQIEKGTLSIDDGPFFYEVFVASSAVKRAPKELFPAAAYEIDGIFQLPKLAEDRERVSFRKLPATPLEERSLDAYADAELLGKNAGNERGAIVIRREVYDTLREGLELSHTVENGGYLLGLPYRRAGSPSNEDDPDFQWIIEITDAVQAEGAWGKPGLLLFTGESWSRIARLRDSDFPDRKLVAWFHTHLFAASDFGLSGLDQDLHRRFLTQQWQVAVLLNIDEKGERTVRCFQRFGDADLTECGFHVVANTP